MPVPTPPIHRMKDRISATAGSPPEAQADGLRPSFLAGGLNLWDRRREVAAAPVPGRPGRNLPRNGRGDGRIKVNLVFHTIWLAIGKDRELSFAESYPD